jgi:uncharacterized protein (TIGR03067 family)
MYRRLLVVVLVLGFGVAAGPRPEMVERERQRLEGTWKVTRADAGGTPIPQKEFRDLRLTFKGDKFTARRGDDDAQEGSFTIDPTKNPKEMDITRRNGPARGQKQLAVYQLNGDLLTICSCESETERPTGFDTREQPTWTVMVLRRVP